MTVESHPFPERTFWRTAPPVTAAVLAVVGFVVMLGVFPGPQTVVLVVVLVAQGALMGGRSLYLQRTARLEDPPVRRHMFFFAWSFFAGATYLLDRDLSLGVAAEHVAAGLLFAVLFMGLYGLGNRPSGRRGADPAGLTIRLWR